MTLFGDEKHLGKHAVLETRPLVPPMGLMACRELRVSTRVAQPETG
jgi:hypothetical protein